MMAVKIGGLNVQVDTGATTTEIRIGSRYGSKPTVNGTALTTETKAALKAILAYIS